MRSFVALIVFLLHMNVSFGAGTCTNYPDGFLLKFDSSTLQYCEGNTGPPSWYNILNPPLGPTCTLAEEGLMNYVGGFYKLCMSGQWTDLKSCLPTALSCYDDGLLKGSKVGPIFCNGTNWITVDSTCPSLNCAELIDGQSCVSSSSNCYWQNSACIDVAALCSSIFSAITCNATSPCSWYSGSCISPL